MTITIAFLDHFFFGGNYSQSSINYQNYIIQLTLASDVSSFLINNQNREFSLLAKRFDVEKWYEEPCMEVA